VPLDLQPHVLATNRVQPEFFQALGLMPIRGRVFFAEPSDTSAAPSEVVVSESMAKRFWPTGGAIGGRFRPSDKAPWSTVVGVVHDSWVPVNQSSGRFDFQVYAPLRLPSFVESIVVRTTASDAVVVPRIIEAIRRTAPSLKVGRIETAESVIDRGLASPRFMATLLGAFAAVAFALTIVGLYGVIAYTVSQRTREIGLRMALGARARDVSWMVVFDGAFLATLGMLLGLVAAAGATRWMRSLLYGVQPGDPATYLSVGAGLVVTAVLASYVPARRAARVDPVAALRDE
jgi:putative ABC transport system permease protein